MQNDELSSEMIELYDKIQSILKSKGVRYDSDNLICILNPLDTIEKTIKMIEWLEKQKQIKHVMIVENMSHKIGADE